jgi:peroxiredoxin
MVDFDVVDLPETDAIEVGETAPNFTRPLATAEFWEDVALTDLLDAGPVCLVFHPMDGAFPTTYVYNELRDRDVDEYGVQVVGLSISSPYEHETTIRERGIEHFTGIFSDPANDVAERYGVEHALDGMTGIEEPRPAIFVIDPDQTVRYAWVADEWPDFPDYEALEAALADH